MKMVLISDIHDHIHNLRELLGRAPGEARTLVCAGDLCSPFMVDELDDGFDGRVHVVFGNNDGDTHRLTRAASGRRGLTLHGEFAELGPEETGGAAVAVHHFPEVGRRLAEGDRYDLVCFGHSHEWEVGRAGETVYVNPGEVMGRLGPPTAAVFDAEAAEVSRLELEETPA